jgi:hypothetical protein
MKVYHRVMSVGTRGFIERVTALYSSDPGYVSSIPFWKLEGLLLRSGTHD